jgi:hypothetical protein
VLESEQFPTSCNLFHNQDLYIYSVLPLPICQIVISSERQATTTYPFYHTTDYNVSTQKYSSKDKGDLCWATRPSIFDQPIEAQLRANIFLAFSFSEWAAI